MKITTKHLAIFATIMGLVVITCIFMIISGTVTLSISGFAVDSRDRLYIGTEKEINIYQNGEIIHTIEPPTSRSYVFTIEKDEIILATPSTVYRMNLEGDIAGEQEDPSAGEYNRLQWKKAFVSRSGDSYKKVGFLLTRIIKNDHQVVYQVSTLSVVVKLILAICFIALFSTPVYLYKNKKKEM
ncbi:MAG: hypothetical protein IKM59_01745 [Oscillospiraceae bacterium]|nr:hypothetical protein [Oscillospiraceae bacterium]